MLRFITGGRGTGKSTHVINEIANDLKSGKRVILMVPEQQAVIAENAVENAAADIPTINLEILNFKRLCNRVFREYGGLSYSYVGKGVRNLILWNVLNRCKSDLREFKSVSAADKNFINMMSEAINEFYNYNVSPDILSRISNEITGRNKRFADKLHDAALIYGTFESVMKNDYNALTDELRHLSVLLNEHDFFNGYNVYIDSFNGFTQIEYDIIGHIMRQADNITITIACDLDDTRSIYDNVHRMYNELVSMAESTDTGHIVLTEKLRFHNDELKFLADNLWLNVYCESPYLDIPRNINVIECGNIFEEAEAVAKDITKKIRNGARYRDITVIMRDVTSYQGIIDAVFDRYEIPYFMSVRIELSSEPLIKLISSAFAIISNYWRMKDVISYVKTGLVDVSYDESDALESYVTTWNINGNRWINDKRWMLNPAGYTDRMTDTDREILDIVNELKLRINQPLLKLSAVFGTENHTVKSISAALYQYLTELDIPTKLQKKSDDKQQLWNSLMSAFDQLVVTSGEMIVSADEYCDLLMMIINETDIGKIPAAIDEVVIGNAGKLRTGTVAHTYILGVNDGIFPKSENNRSIFSDTERKILEENNINLSFGTDMHVTDELLYFYDSATCAGESLTIIYSSSDLNGNKQRQSSACEQILEMFPALQPIKYSEIAPESLIEGYHASFDYTQIYKNTQIGNALVEIYRGDEDFITRLTAINIPISQEEYKLPEEITHDIFGDEIIMTQSRIDNYVMCKFSYCCKYLLRLAEKRQAIFRGADIGNFIHRILELYMIRYYDGYEHDFLPDDSKIMELLEEIIDEYKLSMSGGLEMMNLKLDHMIERLKKSLFLLIKNIHEEFLQSDFIPRFFEESVTIGSKSGDEIAAPYKIQLNDGKTMYITGVIDRIDTYTKGNRIYLRVVDYKTGIKDFSMDDIKMGLNLQMLLYLFALWKNPTERLKHKIGGTEILPAGVLYFSARIPDVTLKTEEEKQIVIELTNEQLTRKGVLLNDVEILQAMEKNLGGRYIPVKLKSSSEISKSSEKSLLTIDEFDELISIVNDRIISIGKELNNGDMSAIPLKTSRHDACEYCANKPICRREL